LTPSWPTCAHAAKSKGAAPWQKAHAKKSSSSPPPARAKNKKTTPDKMLIMKFDPKARKHVEYKEVKLK
jgi:hypothetical protein